MARREPAQATDTLRDMIAKTYTSLDQSDPALSGSSPRHDEVLANDPAIRRPAYLSFFWDLNTTDWPWGMVWRFATRSNRPVPEA